MEGSKDWDFSFTEFSMKKKLSNVLDTFHWSLRAEIILVIEQADRNVAWNGCSCNLYLGTSDGFNISCNGDNMFGTPCNFI